MKHLFALSIFVFVGICGLQAQKSKLKVGKKAPGFEITTLEGNTVTLEKLLENNKYVLVHFFIGSWHKYDTAYLADLQSIYPKLFFNETQVIAITREKPVYLNQLKESLAIDYIIGLDPDWITMSQYGVATRITPNYVPLKHNEFKSLNYKHTGSKDAMIPIPATYLIGQDGRVVWLHFDPDYRRRPDVNEILNQT